MVREMVTVQVGQCGNQIGRRFWAELLHEAAAQQQASGGAGGGTYDAAMSAFFRNVDARYEPPAELAVGAPLSSLRARALLIDTEEGVVSETLRDPRFGDLFDAAQLVTDVSGAGNNWGHGYGEYGPKYGDEIEAAASAALERCDSPQAFFFLHSVGGGTGSGLGSAVLERFVDAFPDLCRFSVAVYPGGDDEDVVTAPYNAVLATQRLTACADCVVPLENQALLDVCARRSARGAQAPASGRTATAAKASKSGFDETNDVAAQLLSHLTAGARYSGGLNIDVNEIATNLVPFPRLHYLTASYAPLLPRDFGGGAAAAPDRGGGDDRARHPRHVQRLFADAASPLSRLVATYDAQPARPAATLAVALLARGDVVSADVAAAAARLRPQLRLPPWNPDGFKVGLCAVPPLRASRAVLCLANSTAIARNFSALRDRFVKLYRAKAMVHHYANYIDGALFDEALADLEALVGDYELAEQRPAALYAPPPAPPPDDGTSDATPSPPAPPSVLL